MKILISLRTLKLLVVHNVVNNAYLIHMNRAVNFSLDQRTYIELIKYGKHL